MPTDRQLDANPASLTGGGDDGDGPRLPAPACRFCGQQLVDTFVDLGLSPLCQNVIRPEQLDQMEEFYPLHARVCRECLLVQVGEYVSPSGIFTEYAYFSSYSDSWLAHARAYVEMISNRLSLGPGSFVVELASNDGYLLQYFSGPRVCGVEPARNVAEVALSRGIPTRIEFFGVDSARRMVEAEGQADLVIGNNVLAQVPDLNDFIAGIELLLAPEGVATLEFPHLLKLIQENQFDTIYHEHFSYFSLLACQRIFGAHGLVVFDVDHLSSHGGSLRLYLAHAGTAPDAQPRVQETVQMETAAGLGDPSTYGSFTNRVQAVKFDLLSFLIEAKRSGKMVAGYGAPGKGNTLLNYCGIRTDLLAFTVDRNPYKQGTYTPGTRIPVFTPEKVVEARPDYLLLLPWNLRRELVEQLVDIRTWGGSFVVAIPQLEVF